MAREKTSKDSYIGGRVDADFKEIVEAYVQDSREVETEAQLLRRALEEFMRNHPITEDN